MNARRLRRILLVFVLVDTKWLHTNCTKIVPASSPKQNDGLPSVNAEAILQEKQHEQHEKDHEKHERQHEKHERQHKKQQQQRKPRMRQQQQPPRQLRLRQQQQQPRQPQQSQQPQNQQLNFPIRKQTRQSNFTSQKASSRKTNSSSSNSKPQKQIADINKHQDDHLAGWTRRRKLISATIPVVALHVFVLANLFMCKVYKNGVLYDLHSNFCKSDPSVTDGDSSIYILKIERWNVDSNAISTVVRYGTLGP